MNNLKKVENCILFLDLLEYNLRNYFRHRPSDFTMIPFNLKSLGVESDDDEETNYFSMFQYIINLDTDIFIRADSNNYSYTLKYQYRHFKRDVEGKCEKKLCIRTMSVEHVKSHTEGTEMNINLFAEYLVEDLIKFKVFCEEHKMEE